MEAVGLAKRTRATIHRWIAIGRLDTVTIGGHRFVNRAQVLEVAGKLDELLRYVGRTST